jgi:sporulation protein YqfC
MLIIGSFLFLETCVFSLHEAKKTYINNSICNSNVILVLRRLYMGKSLKSSHNKFKKDAKDTLYKGIDTKKKKIEPKLSFLEELSGHFNLPTDIIAGAPIITATGRNEICLENYKGIIEYNGSLVKVQTKACKICIEGNELNILYFTEDEMKITGYIKAIYYQ